MKRAVFTVPIYFVVLAALLAPVLPTSGGAGSKASKSLAKGSQAPDFELPVLKITTDKKGNHTGAVTDEKVKVADLRDQQKTVVLFLSSYT